MSEFKGTKGKWYYDHAQESVLSEDLYMIADIFPPHNRENALLISKAPEMFGDVRNGNKRLRKHNPSISGKG